MAPPTGNLTPPNDSAAKSTWRNKKSQADILYPLLGYMPLKSRPFCKSLKLSKLFGERKI